MKSEIIVIAEAILANTQVLKMLIEKLPPAVAEKVAEKVAESNPTPAPAPVATPAPAPVATPAPAPVVVETPTPVTVTVSPVVVETAAAPAKPTHAPFTTQKEMVGWIMGVYQVMGPTKGAQIQGVLDKMGIKNISEVKPEQYQVLFDNVEALKNGA
jgi:hypothetical protein